jgi:hypothetical protein
VGTANPSPSSGGSTALSTTAAGEISTKLAPGGRGPVRTPVRTALCISPLGSCYRLASAQRIASLWVTISRCASSLGLVAEYGVV